ncbi:MAG TPA: hypothetical protein VHP30_04735, partial [Ignavibacteriales bacterium]|nr:hypothetical protein [Ignavibacteriales bacterium]
MKGTEPKNMNKTTLYGIILALMLLSACAPDEFTLNKGVYIMPVGGLIMTSIDDVEQVNNNSIILRNSGRASLGVYALTQSDIGIN